MADAVVDPPTATAGAGWYFFDSKGRFAEGSNVYQRRLIALGGMRAEINNGGFDQWFLNSSGDKALDALGFVDEVRHHQLAELLRSAMARFSSPFPVDREVRHRELLSLGENWDDDLTRRYYAIEESDSLDELMDGYVASRWTAFFRTVH